MVPSGWTNTRFFWLMLSLWRSELQMGTFTKFRNGYRMEWKERGRERSKIKQNTHTIIVAKNVRRERGRERQQRHTLHLKRRRDGGSKNWNCHRYGILWIGPLWKSELQVNTHNLFYGGVVLISIKAARSFYIPERELLYNFCTKSWHQLYSCSLRTREKSFI